MKSEVFDLMKSMFCEDMWDDEVGTRFNTAVKRVTQKTKSAADKMLSPVEENSEVLTRELEDSCRGISLRLREMNIDIEELRKAIDGLHPDS